MPSKSLLTVPNFAFLTYVFKFFSRVNTRHVRAVAFDSAAVSAKANFILLLSPSFEKPFSGHTLRLSLLDFSLSLNGSDVGAVFEAR